LGAIEEGEEELVIQENVAFEEFEKPQWDLNKPLLDVDQLLQEQKEMDEIMNDDLSEFRVKHGVIT
jgi:hypothetical protein